MRIKRDDAIFADRYCSRKLMMDLSYPVENDSQRAQARKEIPCGWPFRGFREAADLVSEMALPRSMASGACKEPPDKAGFIAALQRYCGNTHYRICGKPVCRKYQIKCLRFF